MISININNQQITTDLEGDTPLLWLLRDELGLTGTKFGCGIGQCGACTVHLDNQAVRSCSLPISAIGEGKVNTIDGAQTPQLEALKAAWTENSVPQCGYCQPGQLMSAAALLNRSTNPDDAQILEAMSGNICRCGTYERIKCGIKQAAENLASEIK